MQEHFSSEARKAMRTMKKLQGIAFDRTYMDYQISSHKKALEIINGYILPRVQNPALKNYTLQMKQNIENHLQEATSIRRFHVTTHVIEKTFHCEIDYVEFTGSSNQGRSETENGIGSEQIDISKN